MRAGDNPPQENAFLPHGSYIQIMQTNKQGCDAVDSVPCRFAKLLQSETGIGVNNGYF